jgi:hypothetical protein
MEDGINCPSPAEEYEAMALADHIKMSAEEEAYNLSNAELERQMKQLAGETRVTTGNFTKDQS